MSNMLRKGTIWLLVLLALALLLSYSGARLRMSNEALNENVITAVDYKEFVRTANLANMDMAEVRQRLREAGVNTVALTETSLRDLAYSGDLYLSAYGDFVSLTKTVSPDIYQATQAAVGNISVSPSNLVASTANPKVATFLRERLSARFTPDQLIMFDQGGKSYFIINSELIPIVLETNPSEKNKAPSKDLDARLGFDEVLISQLKAEGFNVILRPGLNMGSAKGYQAEYDQVVANYGIKYLIFAGNDLPGTPNDYQWLADMIKNRGLTIGLVEHSTQLQYLPQKGMETVMAAADYPINRVYSATNDEFGISIDERYYRWVRATIDRGIRIVYIPPFKDTKLSYSDNLNNTINMIAKFHGTIVEKGFAIDQPLPKLSSQFTSGLHRATVTFSLFLAGTLYLLYLFRPRIKNAWLLGWIALGILGALGSNFVMDMNKLNALAAAIIYPSFSSLLLLIYLRNNRDKSYMVQLAVSLAIILGINGLGMYTIVTSMADIRYMMNVLYFSGVKLSFLLPLCLFLVNYVAAMIGFGDFKDKAFRFLLAQPNYLVLGLLIVGGGAVYYYLGRSGNAVVSVSGLEIRMREILETLFLARPRFKELLIGYPALMLMIYWYKKFNQDLVLLVLGVGVMMGSISMVNSFSHDFTAVMVSMNRTLAGVLTGLVIGLGFLAAVKIGEWLWRLIETRASHYLS